MHLFCGSYVVSRTYAILLINDVNYPGAPCVLSELQKWRLALNRIRDAAKAWHRYEGMWQRC